MTEAPRLVVDTTSPIPPYEQLRGQLTELIRHGVLAAGDRLPPVRQLAADLGLAAGTVARAYRELEQAELVRSRRGAGTRVTMASPPTSPSERGTELAARAAVYVADARLLGATDDELLAAVRTAVDRT
jgi:DNA-binding transcriptional regulator YhcF (GntR family)